MSNRSQGMHAIVSQSVEHRQELCMCMVVVLHLYSKPAFFKSCALTHPKKVECILDTKATSQKGYQQASVLQKIRPRPRCQSLQGQYQCQSPECFCQGLSVAVLFI